MKIDLLIPAVSSKVLFSLASFKMVPKGPGCYVLTTFDNNILYIGLSQNLSTRFKQHIANLEKTKPTIEGKAIWFYYLKDSSNNLERLERTWLNQYLNLHGKKPIFNKVDSPVN